MNVTTTVHAPTAFNYASSRSKEDARNEQQNAATLPDQSSVAGENKDTLAASPGTNQENVLYTPSNATVSTQDNSNTYENLKKHMSQGTVSGVVVGAVYAATQHLPVAAVVGYAVGCAYSGWDTSAQSATDKPAQALSTQEGQWLVEGAGAALTLTMMAATGGLSYYALQRLHSLRV